MKVLISVTSLKESKIAADAGADILDIKNPNEGSLGAQLPWIVSEIANEFKGSGILCSATLGDLPFKPGTAALAAYGAASCGAKYIKSGLYGIRNHREAFLMMKSIKRAVRMISTDALVVASGYADYKRFGGISYNEIISASSDAGADVVMVDTAIKDGKNLFDAMFHWQIEDFINDVHDAGMLAAIAGSIKFEHLGILSDLNPDIIGVRGAVCDNADRTSGIVHQRVTDLMSLVNELEHSEITTLDYSC